MAISLSPTARDLIRSTFFGKDFDTYRDEVIASINAIFGDEVASNIVASEQGVMLIEMVSFALSTLSWYGDRQADDTTLRDARLRVAAVTIARQLGYKARAAVPPVVEASVVLGLAPPVPLTIASGQSAAGPDGLVFETIADVVFDVGQVGSGSPIGMIVNDIVIDPATPATIYSATSTGMLKTIDSGLNWSAVNSGLTNLNITALVIDPISPTTLYAGTSGGGVFKTTNGGTSWITINSGLSNLNVLSLAINPATPSNILVGTDTGGVFRSTDSGATWKAVNAGLADFVIKALAYDPITPTTVYAGTFSLGVFKSVNSGVDWVSSSTGLATLDVNHIAVDPVTPATIYVSTAGGGVFKTTTAGALWVPANIGLTSFNPLEIAIDPVTPATLYAATADSGVFKSTNSAATWAESNDGLTVTQTSAVSVDPATVANIYAGTSGGGIFASINAALTWTAINVGIDDPIKTTALREGETLEEVFRSNGQPNQFFELSTVPEGKSIAQDSPQVTVGGILWPEVPLLTFDRTDQVEIDYGFIPPRVVFGDGIAGNIPPEDSEIRVNYFVTSGTGGAVASNTVTSFIGPIVAGTTVIPASMTHESPSTPGSDPESIESIKINAPLLFQTAERAVTKDDLTGLINSFIDPTYGSVAKGRANAPRSAVADAEAQSIIATLVAFGVPTTITDRLNDYLDRILSSNCEANSIVAQILAEDSVGRYATAPLGLAQALQTFLNGIAESTVAATVTDGSVNLLSVNVTAEISLLNTFVSEVLRSQVEESVRLALQNTLLGRDYAVSLRISDLYELVEAVEGVNFSHISMVVKNNLGDDITATRVNKFGDLEITEFEVITMGDVPVVQFLN